ncbi:MAG: holo-ACP synthase [Puniceicoccales bacterium]|jgi:holo-[acyl-carrier protein] synthase|nr:holo-ACP synthase [Puniceicoccales bacterium]
MERLFAMAMTNIICSTNMAACNIFLGTDIVDVERINRLIQKYGNTFLFRIFNVNEIAYCWRTVKSANSFAARFATKEAFAKALGTGIGKNVGWKDISVGKKSSGEPYIILSKKGKNKIKALGISSIKVSISHTKTLAQAVVMLIK